MSILKTAPIPLNKVRSRNKIEQHEHCDIADARRVNLVSPDGQDKVDVITDTFGTKRLAVDVNATINTGDINVDIDADTGDNIAISCHANPRNVTSDVDKTAAQLSTTVFTEIFTYTSVGEVLITRVIKIKADTFGSFRVKVDGVIADYFRTSFSQRDCKFEFLECLDVPAGKNITVEFRPERIRLTDFNFFTRLEGYID